MKHLELGFIGFGLIGGSIAKALKKRNIDVTIRVYTRRKNPDLEQGVREGVIDELLYKIDEQLSSCDVIFLCAPVLRNIDYLPLLKKIIKPSCILTDVGSVKGNICQAAREHELSKHFIGGHPMAGSEKTGYANSTDILLENAYYLLTPTENNIPEDIETLTYLVNNMGANCVVLPPEEHDMITAAISHVPHIIAVALVNMVRQSDNEEENMKAFAAGGFRDMTRIASSSPEMWQDICIANGISIDRFLSLFEKEIENFRAMIVKGDIDGIHQTFSEAGEYRNSIPSKKSSLIARSYDIYVNIDDRAGAIATIATILSVNGISIKNIGILHNREFADGVLKIELYNEEDALSSERLLKQNRYDVVKRN